MISYGTDSDSEKEEQRRPNPRRPSKQEEEQLDAMMAFKMMKMENRELDVKCNKNMFKKGPSGIQIPGGHHMGSRVRVPHKKET